MKCLIIGNEGYVGSYLFEYLKSKNLDVVGYGNRQTDYNNLTKEFLEEFTHIVLLAGHSSVKMCEGELYSPWYNNVVNFKTLLQKKPHETKLIYASSASVYGNSNSKIFDETDISLDFVNNYDLTKVSLDLYALQQINQGEEIVGLRFGTVNGGSKTIRRDLMINSMVYNAITDGVIFTSNKEVNRPILSIKDLSRAIERIITNWVFWSGIYNLASFNSNVKDIANTVKDIINVNVIDRGDFPGVYNFNISTNKFKNEYDFDFVETIESVVEDVVCCYSQTPKIVSRDTYFKYDRLPDSNI